MSKYQCSYRWPLHIYDHVPNEVGYLEDAWENLQALTIELANYHYDDIGRFYELMRNIDSAKKEIADSDWEFNGFAFELKEGKELPECYS